MVERRETKMVWNAGKNVYMLHEGSLAHPPSPRRSEMQSDAKMPVGGEGGKMEMSKVKAR